MNSTLVDLKVRFDTLDKVMSCGEGKTLSSSTVAGKVFGTGIIKELYCKVSDATTSIPFNTLLAFGAIVAAAVVML